MNISSDRTFLKNNENACTDQPKMAAKIIWKKRQDMKTFILQHSNRVGRTRQPAKSKGDNRLFVLVLHSRCSEELYIYIGSLLLVLHLSSKR